MYANTDVDTPALIEQKHSLVARFIPKISSECSFVGDVVGCRVVIVARDEIVLVAVVVVLVFVVSATVAALTSIKDSTLADCAPLVDVIT
jgi:hypothetical protein